MRHRASGLRQPSAWLLAAAGLAFYVGVPSLLVADAFPAGGAGRWWLPLAGPPLLYALLLVGMPRVPLRRRAAGVLVLTGVHAGLAVLTPLLYGAVGLGATPSALDGSIWAFPAVAVVQLLAVPLLLFPLRDRLARPRGRAARRRAASAGGTATPPPLRAGRAWEDITLHTAGGERLREEATGGPATPEWRRPTREPTGRIEPAAQPTPPPVAVPETLTPRAVPPIPADAPSAPRFEVAGPARLLPVERADTVSPLLPVPTPAPAPAPSAVTPAAPVASASLPAVVAPPVILAPVPEPERAAMPVEAVDAPAPSLALETLPPVPAAARPEAAAEPSLPAPASGAGSGIELAEIVRALAPAGPLEVETRTLMGITLHTACAPRLAPDAVVGSAFRLLSFLVESPGAQAVTQTTVRGGAGALVLTPLGPLAAGGPLLAVTVPQRGTLALLELLSLDIAADCRAARAGLAGASAAGGGPAAAALSPLGEEPVPPRLAALARSVTAGGPLRPLCLADPAARLVLYLLVGPDVDPQWVGRLAADLSRVMEAEDEPGGVGPFRSVVVRLGSQRVVVSAVAATPERSTLLVAAGPADPRPGLGRLQLERLAARLAGAAA